MFARYVGKKWKKYAYQTSMDPQNHNHWTAVEFTKKASSCKYESVFILITSTFAYSLVFHGSMVLNDFNDMKTSMENTYEKNRAVCFCQSIRWVNSKRA